MKIQLFHEGESFEIEVDAQPDSKRIRIGEELHEISDLVSGRPIRVALVDGRPLRYLVHRGPDRMRIALRGECFEFGLRGDTKSRRSARGTANPETRAPMPGKVLQVSTEVGANVQPGDPLIILEAMKMENVLTAEVTGTVAEIHVRPGDMVEPGKVLVVVRANS